MECYQEQAAEQRVEGKDLPEYISEGTAKYPVYVRQVLATDKTFPVRERMLRRYAAQVGRGGGGVGASC